MGEDSQRGKHLPELQKAYSRKRYFAGGGGKEV